MKEDDAPQTSQEETSDLFVVELDERLEFGALLLNNFNPDSNSLCTNGNGCVSNDSNCFNVPCQ